MCLLPVGAKAKIKGNKYGATRSAGDYRRKVQLARLCALGRDVYYERGRKPKESIIKYEATRSEGDYPEEGATRALMRYRRERHGVRGRGRGQTCNRDNMRPGP